MGCGEDQTINNIQKKLKQGETLTSKQQCIADTVVSTIVDPKNVMLYIATFDVLIRGFISEKSQMISYCHNMIAGGRKSDAFEGYAENCPEELKELSNEQLKALDIHAHKLARMAADFNGSPIDVVLGSCVDF